MLVTLLKRYFPTPRQWSTTRDRNAPTTLSIGECADRKTAILCQQSPLGMGTEGLDSSLEDMRKTILKNKDFSMCMYLELEFEGVHTDVNLLPSIKNTNN